jgi:lysyl-tRNA synthetase class 2
LTENEKLVFDILAKQVSMELADLKAEAGLSNKQWDKAVKGLAKHGVTQVTKTDDALIIEIVQED